MHKQYQRQEADQVSVIHSPPTWYSILQYITLRALKILELFHIQHMGVSVHVCVYVCWYMHAYVLAYACVRVRVCV